VKLVTFRTGNRRRPGLVCKKDTVLDLEKAFFHRFRRPFHFEGLLSFLQEGGAEKIRELDVGSLAQRAELVHGLGEVTLDAPLPRPPKIICIGLNYRSHAAEQNRPAPEKPLLFLKAPNVTIGSGGTIRLPAEAPDKVDYEVELAAVVGREGYQIPREQAAGHILGYTILLDISARDVQMDEKQWFRGKSFDTFAPMGPWIVTPDEVRAGDASIELRVNGSVMQSGRTSDMVFNSEYLISYISNTFPLEVGDLISTGTPSGVGVFRNPPVFLKPGDELEGEIEGIGVLRANVTLGTRYGA
jgi:2-keto-4-pentenoate hydratase/2-oxohepta-3-ene-1,7-dioic acid hydratase in catechol pathway